MTTEQSTGGMDAFTRRYLYLLAAAALAALVWWVSSVDSRVSELNDLLQSDPAVSAYPYKFRVLSLENGIAEMSSPRSAKMSAIQGLRILFPPLQDASAVSAEMMAAQEELARVQSRAAALVAEQEDVGRVVWSLDEQWLSSHGVYLQ